MANEPNFEAGAPIDPIMGDPAAMNPAMTPEPQAPSQSTPAAPTKKLVDTYTAMLFVAAIFLLVGALALAWEKSRYGDLWGNTWQIPPSYKISGLERAGNFDSFA